MASILGTKRLLANHTELDNDFVIDDFVDNNFSMIDWTSDEMSEYDLLPLIFHYRSCSDWFMSSGDALGYF